MTPTWYSIIADEATDVKNTEQLNLAIRWVDSNYKVHEDSVGLLRVTDTKAELFFMLLKTCLLDVISHYLCVAGKLMMVRPTCKGEEKE